MPVTQQQIDDLNAAIASAERQVTVGDETVIYRSVTDLKAARDDLQTKLNEQNAIANARPPRRRTLLQYGGRGYHRGE